MRLFRLKRCNRVHGLHFAPASGRLLAVGGAEALMVDAAVWLDLATGDVSRRLDFLAAGYAVSPDGTRLVLGGADRYAADRFAHLRYPVQWTDPRPGANGPWREVEIGASPRPGVQVFGLAFAPDGNRMAVGLGRQFRRTADLGVYEWEYEVRVWRFDPPGLEASLPGSPESFAGALAFSPDGARLAFSGGTHGEPPVHVHDFATGRVEYDYEPRGARTRSLAWSPDGRRLAVANAREVDLLLLGHPDQTVFLRGHKGQVNAVAYSPDGRRLLTACHDGVVRVWEADGRLVREYDWKVGPVTTVAVAPDGLTAAAAGSNGRVVVFDLDG